MDGGSSPATIQLLVDEIRNLKQRLDSIQQTPAPPDSFSNPSPDGAESYTSDMAGSLHSDASAIDGDLYMHLPPPRYPDRDGTMTSEPAESGNASPAARTAMARSDPAAKSGHGQSRDTKKPKGGNLINRTLNVFKPSPRINGRVADPAFDADDKRSSDGEKNGAGEEFRARAAVPMNEDHGATAPVGGAVPEPPPTSSSSRSPSSSGDSFVETINRLFTEHREQQEMMREYRTTIAEYLVAIERGEKEKANLQEAAEWQRQAAEEERETAARKLAEIEERAAALELALEEARKEAKAAQELASELEQERMAASDRAEAAAGRAMEAQRKLEHMKRKCDRYVKVLFGKVEELRASSGVAAALRRQYERLGTAFQDLTEKMEKANALEEERHSVQAHLHQDICAALGIDGGGGDFAGSSRQQRRRLQTLVDAVYSVDAAINACASDLLGLILHKNHDTLPAAADIHDVDSVYNYHLISRNLDPDQAPSSIRLYKLGLQELLCTTFFSDFERLSSGVGDVTANEASAAATDSLHRLSSFNDFYATAGGGQAQGRRFKSPRNRRQMALEVYHRCRSLGTREICELLTDNKEGTTVFVGYEATESKGGGGEGEDRVVEDNDGDSANGSSTAWMRLVGEEFYRFANGKWCPEVFQQLLNSATALSAYAAVTAEWDGGKGGRGRRAGSAGGPMDGRRGAVKLPEALMSEENPLAGSFCEAARAVWLLQKVALWLQAEIVRVPREADFDPEYMEALPEESGSATAGGENGQEPPPPPPTPAADNPSAPHRLHDVIRVNFMCLPGFMVADDVVVKARVCVTPRHPL